jgi:hypothetical protein
MELVTLHSYQSNKVLYVTAAWLSQQLEVAEIWLNVLIDGMHFNWHTRHFTGRETSYVVDGAIGHEALPESLH